MSRIITLSSVVALALSTPVLQSSDAPALRAMPTSLTKVLFQESLAILRQCWPREAPIRLLTVTASTLCPEDEGAAAQLSFLAEIKPDDPRQARIEQAVDSVRQRFGKRVIAPGTEKVE